MEVHPKSEERTGMMERPGEPEGSNSVPGAQTRHGREEKPRIEPEIRLETKGRRPPAICHPGIAV
jgi:hypothetical protein